MKKILNNNSYLLDTHIWVWLFNEEKKRINKKVLDITENIIGRKGKNKLFLSPISVWEVALLYKKNKFNFNILLFFYLFFLFSFS